MGDKRKVLLIICGSLIILSIIIVLGFLDTQDRTGMPNAYSDDLDTAREIKGCITSYMIDTGDVNLKFGDKNKSYTVEEIFDRLSKKKAPNGESYLPSYHDYPQEYKPISDVYKGWEIVIKPKEYDVSVTLSKKGNSISFVN